MLKRYHITLGATTTAGGKVITASSIVSIHGVRIALEDDKIFCEACNSPGVIKLAGPRLSERFNNRQVALNDDLCLCNCSPPPKLVSNQTFKSQTIDVAWHDAQASASAATTAQLNTAETSATEPKAIPLLLLDPDTQAPFKHRPYRLQLAGKVIDGTTDQNGATRPLTASERASLLTWHCR